MDKGERRIRFKSYIFHICLLNLGWQTSAWAQESFEKELRRQLDRLFYSEQYMLDVRRSSQFNSQGSGLSQNLQLPGLAWVPLPDPTNQKTTNKPEGNSLEWDILIVFDNSVTPVRQNIAEEIVKRQLETLGIGKKSKLEFRRQSILKIMPKELAPLQQDGHRNSPNSAGKSQNDQNSAESKTPQINLFEFIEHKKELASKVLIALWTAFASLIGIYGLLSRFKSNKPIKSESLPIKPAGGDIQKSPTNSPNTNALKRSALTKEELFSKDEAVMKQVEEMVGEAQNSPEKVAQILSKWLENSDEKGKYGSFFLKNCDIKTTEALCKNLHPSDIDKLVSRNIGDFDLFSEENRRALELMRNDLAVMAAQQSFKEKEKPLSFLKIVSDDDLIKILEETTIRELAMVATLVPAHRLSKVLEQHPEGNFRKLLFEVARLDELSPEDFAPLQKKLEKKLEKVGSIVVNKENKRSAIKQLLTNIHDPELQAESARNTLIENPDYYHPIRPSITLYLDLINLPGRALKMFLRAVDGQALGTVLSTMKSRPQDFEELMPEAIRQQYQEVVLQSHDAPERIQSWKNLLTYFEDLKSSGLISTAELAQAQKKTDAFFQDQMEPKGTEGVKISDAA